MIKLNTVFFIVIRVFRSIPKTYINADYNTTIEIVFFYFRVSIYNPPTYATLCVYIKSDDDIIIHTRRDSSGVARLDDDVVSNIPLGTFGIVELIGSDC
jgi:hypothetical protein